jgi:Putative transposase of IS4/5 family (DUF4096)
VHVSSKCQYSSCLLMAGVVIVLRGGTSTRFDDDRRAVGAAGAAAPGGGEHRRARGQAREVGPAPGLDAIFYLVRGGIAWRALPADFPPHQTVYALFRR